MLEELFLSLTNLVPEKNHDVPRFGLTFQVGPRLKHFVKYALYNAIK